MNQREVSKRARIDKLAWMRCRCPSGLVAGTAPEGGVFCNECSVIVMGGKPTHSCRTCDDDMCQRCFERGAADRVSRGQRQSQGAAALPPSTASSGGPAATRSRASVTSRPASTTVPSNTPTTLVKAKLSAAMERERERRRLLEEQRQIEEAHARSLEEARLAAIRKAIQQAQDEAEDVCTFVDGALVCAEQGLAGVPACVVKGYADVATKVDFSWNPMVSLESLAPFFFLEELAVDNGELASPLKIPELPFLRVLSLNNNKLTDLHDLVRGLKKCPRLALLSLRKNPLCPDALGGIATDGEYVLYRQYLVSQIKTLEYVDSRKVTDQERRRASSRFDNAHADPVTPMADVFQAIQDWFTLNLALVSQYIVQNTRKSSGVSAT